MCPNATARCRAALFASLAGTGLLISASGGGGAPTTAGPPPVAPSPPVRPPLPAPPAVFAWPVGGKEGVDWAINNYVDRNPDAGCERGPSASGARQPVRDSLPYCCVHGLRGEQNGYRYRERTRSGDVQGERRRRRFVGKVSDQIEVALAKGVVETFQATPDALDGLTQGRSRPLPPSASSPFRPDCV